jgi:hypothetical protein
MRSRVSAGPDIPALDGRSPLHLIEAGELDRVARLDAALEHPSANEGAGVGVAARSGVTSALGAGTTL